MVKETEKTKINDFKELMAKVTIYGKEELDYKSPEACNRCGSSICKMVQKCNKLSCYLTYTDQDGAKKTDERFFTLFN